MSWLHKLTLVLCLLLPGPAWAAFPDYASVVDGFDAADHQVAWNPFFGTGFANVSSTTRPDAVALRGTYYATTMTGVRKEIYVTNTSAHSSLMLLTLCLVPNIATARNCYQVNTSAGLTNIELNRVDAGSDTLLGTVAQVLGAGYKFGVSRDDTTGQVRVYVNTGASWSTIIDVTDNTHTGTMVGGLAAVTTSQQFDDYAQGSGASIGGATATGGMMLLQVGK